MAGRASRGLARAFSAQAAKPAFVLRWLGEAPSQTALTEEVAGLPAPAKAPRATRGVTTTTTPSGLRVVTKDDGGSVATVGLCLKGGSRYDSIPGAAAVLKEAAFASTHARSALKLQRDAEALGGRLTASVGRELFVYGGSALRDHLDGVLGILSEAATNTALWPWEIEEMRPRVEAVLEDAAGDPQAQLVDALHAAAFGAASPLGRPILPAHTDLDDITGVALQRHLGDLLNAQNLVVVGHNVKHDVFADAMDKFLLGLPAGVPTTSATTEAPGLHHAAPAAFLGGEALHRRDGPAFVALGLSAPGLGAKAAPTLGVLRALLGGKGAPYATRSRLGRSAHTEAHSFIRALSARTFAYSDAGVLALTGACADHEAGRLVDAMLGFLKDAASVTVTPTELSRARALHKMELACRAECGHGSRDDMARHTLWGGGAAALADQLAAVDRVTAADVNGLAAQLLTSPLAVAGVGGLATLPRYDSLAARLK